MAISTISQAGLNAPITLTSPTLTTPNINSAQFATVTGTAPLYAARAWVNFNGTGTVAIRGSGNVSSITDNGTGDYTVNFTTAMPDVNYSAECTVQYDQSGSGVGGVYGSYARVAPTTTTARFHCQQGGTLYDCTIMAIAVFR